MKDLLISITKGLVQNPDAISVDVSEPDEEGVIVYHLHVAEEDMGRVIGKQGRIAKAIRVVMRAAATRNDAKISVEIDYNFSEPYLNWNDTVQMYQNRNHAGWM